MGFMQGGRGLVVSAVVLIGVLAGCSPGGDPGPEPTRSTSVTGSPTPSLSPAPSPSSSTLPPAPPELNDLGEAGAIATATYFLSLYPYVYNTGDLTTWNELSLPECTFCSQGAAEVQELHGRGGYTAGGDVVVEVSEDARRVEGGDGYVVDLAASIGPMTEFSSDGRVLRESPSGRTEFRVFLDPIENGWAIFEVALDDGSDAE